MRIHYVSGARLRARAIAPRSPELVPQMAALLSDNAWLREGIKLAWAEGLAQPTEASTLTVDSITTLHLEALYAFYMHDVSAEDAAEILAGTRPPVKQEEVEDQEAAAPPLGGRIAAGAAAAASSLARALGDVAGRARSAEAKRLALVKSISAKIEGGDAAAARRALLLTLLLTHLRSSGDVAVPALQWQQPDEVEAATMALRAPDAGVHASGLRSADLPQLMETALSELSFLFAAYRLDCW
jgi:hypothetical protein